MVAKAAEEVKAADEEAVTATVVKQLHGKGTPAGKISKISFE